MGGNSDKATEKMAAMAGRARALAGEVGHGLLELAWPTRCVFCDLPGALLCEDCRAELPFIDQRDACPACGAPYGRVACTECWTRDGPVDHPFAEAVCAAEFDGVAARLAVVYKDQGEQRLSDVIAELIAEAVEERWGSGECGERCGCEELDGNAGGSAAIGCTGNEAENGCNDGDPEYEQADGSTGCRHIGGTDDGNAGNIWIPEAIVPIPATRQAIRRRGFDHILPVAEALGERWGLPVADILAKADAADQRELGRVGRIENMGGAFSLRDFATRIPRSILLVDDVFTTGATLSAASDLLLDVGAEEVRVAALCRVW